MTKIKSAVKVAKRHSEMVQGVYKLEGSKGIEVVLKNGQSLTAETIEEMNAKIDTALSDESVGVTDEVPTTRKQIIEQIGFTSITDEFLILLNSKTKSKYNKFKDWVTSNSYIGFYVKDNEVIINSPRGGSYKYVTDAVQELTGKTLVDAQNYVRQDENLWEVWKAIDQYTGGGEA